MIHAEIKKTLLGADGDMDLELTFSLHQGSFNAVFGKSGAGKTTLLRILAGLDFPDTGVITANSRAWVQTKGNVNLKTEQRDVAFVFQDFALFPNMTIFENLSYASPDKDQSYLEELLEVAQLHNLRGQKPHRLSAGQKQRTALMRALAQKPQLLLLDEPLAALDGSIKKELRSYIKSLHKSMGLTTVMVSHEVAEICELADRVLCLENGKIVKDGEPLEVFTHHDVSGKFQMVGTILKMQKQDFLYIITILAGQEVVRVVVDESEGARLSVGEDVVVASKAFNPIIKRLEAP